MYTHQLCFVHTTCPSQSLPMGILMRQLHGYTQLLQRRVITTAATQVFQTIHHVRASDQEAEPAHRAPRVRRRGLRGGAGDVQGSDRCGDADGRASSDLLRGRVPVRVPLRVNSDLLKRGCDGLMRMVSFTTRILQKLNLEVAGVHLLRTYISTIRRCK